MDPLYFIVTISVLGPVAGSALGVWRRASEAGICIMLCFAAGIMLAISFLDLIPEGIEFANHLVCAAGIASGTVVMYGLDRLIPHVHPEFCEAEQGRRLEKTAVFLMAGIFLHNFPEGMAIAIGGVADEKVSVTIALAIAVHNIPEGICTSSPYFNLTGRRLRAFLYSSSTAIPLLLGFILARFFIRGIPLEVMGFILGATAGLMIYIAADELIPSSCRAGETHNTIFSLMAGVVFVIMLELL